MKKNSFRKLDKEKEERLLVYGVYTNLIQGIKHFDILQTSYRVLTSTLFLATYAAIGFTLSSEVKILPFDRLVAVILIALISLGAITTLWHLDLAFIERLSVSCLSEALKLEHKHSWLPPVHHNMCQANVYSGCSSRKVIFYVGTGSTLIITMGIAATRYSYDINPWLVIPSTAVILFCLFIYNRILKKKSVSFLNLLKQLEE